MTELIIGTIIVIIVIAIYRGAKPKKEDESIDPSATELPTPPKPPTGTPL